MIIKFLNVYVIPIGTTEDKIMFVFLLIIIMFIIACGAC